MQYVNALTLIPHQETRKILMSRLDIFPIGKLHNFLPNAKVSGNIFVIIKKYINQVKKGKQEYDRLFLHIFMNIAIPRIVDYLGVKTFFQSKFTYYESYYN